MGNLTDRLRRGLSRRFKGAEVELRRVPGGRIGGSVIWRGFEGLAQIDRQVELGEAIDDVLSKDQRSRISLILPLTPDEAASIAKG